MAEKTCSRCLLFELGFPRRRKAVVMHLLGIRYLVLIQQMVSIWRIHSLLRHTLLLTQVLIPKISQNRTQLDLHLHRCYATFFFQLYCIIFMLICVKSFLMIRSPLPIYCNPYIIGTYPIGCMNLSLNWQIC